MILWCLLLPEAGEGDLRAAQTARRAFMNCHARAKGKPDVVYPQSVRAVHTQLKTLLLRQLADSEGHGPSSLEKLRRGAGGVEKGDC